ncbi:MAG: efflux RND transporter permease subunit, partial [Verrucomicrobiota bacterium]
AESTTVQEFGQCAVVGVVLSFLAVILIIPLLTRTWLGHGLVDHRENGFVDRNLGRIRPLIVAVTERPTLFSVLGMGGTLLLIALSLQLRPDYRLAHGIPSRSEVSQGMRHLDEAFQGMEFVQVRVRWEEAISAESGEILEVLGEVHDLLEMEELIGPSLSVLSLVASLPGEGDPSDRMRLVELLPPELKRSFFTPERREAIVQFRVRDLGIARYGPVFERLTEGVKNVAEAHPGFSLRLRGNAIWRWENLFQIVIDLVKSLGMASLIIFLVLALVYRSIKIGLISLVPNLFPLAVAAAFLVVAGYNLEIVMVCNFTVCLGIAVDDTVHFLTRYVDERKRRNETEAIEQAFTGVGTALIMTTMILVVGFSTVMFSDSRDHKIFAQMGTITIAAALFADLVFLPALLKRFVSPQGGRELP